MVMPEGTPSQPPSQARRRPAGGLLASRRGRRLLFAVLYFSEGAPIGFVWWTLPVILRRRGVEPDAIGALTGALVLPWALKFLWAPLVDVLRGPRFGSRGWIVASQLVMAASLVPLAWLDLGDRLGLLTALLLVHACAAATQDVAIDALAIRSAPEGERGGLNGWMQVGMLVGRGVFGGAVLELRARLGDAAVIGLLVAAIALVLPVHLAYRPPAPEAPSDGARSGRWTSFARTLGSALARRRTWVALGFAATAGAAFEIAGAMAGPYLVDRGLDDAAIARFFAFPAVAGLGAGALLGGLAADRFGHRRTVAIAGVALAAATVVLARAPVGSAGSAWTVLGALYLCAGVFTASTYAMFMDATDPRLGSTQFSAYMGATNLCEAWSAAVAGRVVAGAGYATAFLLGAVVTSLALPCVAWLRPDRVRAGNG